ncbi:hypothetical protein [Actinomyces polynesiensis]|uniref:hypothetical protein n=1 Tax=Actinomyces polynesiensis TaxID=1325934 RepID=UPI000A51F606|nr:hypothetical protein [Actinomyces polynesiensis]
MRIRWKYIRRTVGVLLLLLLLGALVYGVVRTVRDRDTGSVSGDATACTEIGADQGVFLGVAEQEGTGLQRVTLNVRTGSGATSVVTEDGEGNGSDAGVAGNLFVATTGRPEAADVEVRLTDRDGQVLVLPGVGEAVLAEPNGPQCEPHSWQLTMDLRDGALVPSTP